MARTHVIWGRIDAPAKLLTLPGRVTGIDAATARAAAYRLAAVVMFNCARSASAIGDRAKGKALVACGLRADQLARETERRGAL